MAGAGVTYEWHKEKDDPNFVYIITAAGKGFDLLNEFLFSGTGSIQLTSKGIQIDFQNAGLLNPRSATLRLTGGKIVESNADETQGNTAIWWNIKSGDQVRVILTEASKSPLPFACPLGLLLVGIFVPFRMKFRAQSKRKPFV